jgi:hypothetical protein
LEEKKHKYVKPENKNINTEYKHKMSTLYGVPNGLLIGQQARVDELNERMVARQFPDKPLAPNFDPRPISTKYSLFPALDRRAPPSVPIKPTETHNVHSNFSPATHNGPPQTYLNNIDTESVLRNQTVALQHGPTQGVYVPNSSSDLYKVHVSGDNRGPQPHKGLFTHAPISQTPREGHVQQSKIGQQTFHNHTRIQLRNL